MPGTVRPDPSTLGVVGERGSHHESCSQLVSAAGLGPTAGPEPGPGPELHRVGRREGLHMFAAGALPVHLTGPTPTSCWPPGSRAARASPRRSTHPRLFVTFTAPSFGRVHSRKAQGRLVLPCHPYRQGACCPHGLRDGCWHRHDEDDPRLGEPLCPACYDAQAQVLWNALAPELWRRTTIAVQRALGRLVGLARGRAAPGRADLLRQGGRVPTARGDPLPCRHPPGRGH